MQALLPPWATDAMIKDAAETLHFEIVLVTKVIDKNVADYAPVMIAEAEALLTHEAEGW